MHWHSGKICVSWCRLPDQIVFSFAIILIHRTFLQTVTFLFIFLTSHFQFLTQSHPLIFTPFYFKIASSSLQICRFSHLHTLTPSDTQIRICSNLLTLTSIVRNSQIFSPAVLQKKIHPANFSPAQPEIFSVSHLVQCCFTPKKHTHRTNVFQCCFWAKTEPQEQKTLSQQILKASAASIQKQTCRRKNIFSNAGKNWSEWN